MIKILNRIKKSDSETKLLQFQADDTSAILADWNSAQALVNLLNDFENVSGIKLKGHKTEKPCGLDLFRDVKTNLRTGVIDL